jgi:hypothetical protein
MMWWVKNKGGWERSCMLSHRHAVRDKKEQKYWREAGTGRKGLVLISAQRGRSFFPEKGNVYRPTWSHREPFSQIL